MSEKLTPEELRRIWHEEAAGAKPLPVPVKELERQKKEGTVH